MKVLYNKTSIKIYSRKINQEGKVCLPKDLENILKCGFTPFRRFKLPSTVISLQAEELPLVFLVLQVCF